MIGIVIPGRTPTRAVVLVTMFSVGAAVAYIVGYFMLNLGPDAWRWMLASSAIPALLILTMRLGTPESPRWLLSKGRAEEAEAVLKQMPSATRSPRRSRTPTAPRASAASPADR
jgi:MFS transporter, putative metabolite transport protein